MNDYIKKEIERMEEEFKHPDYPNAEYLDVRLKKLKDFLSSSLKSAWEKGRQSVLEELEEEQKKLLQGFAYKPKK